MIRRKRCCGKRTYLTRAAAERTLDSIWSSVKPGRRLESRAYKCEHGGWHLTSQAVREVSV